MTWNIYSSQNHIRLQKEKVWKILYLQASNLAPKLGRLATASGNSFVVPRVTPSRVIVVLFVILRRIKPGILKLTITIGQSNLSIAFNF